VRSLRRRLGVALIAVAVLTTAGCSHHKKTPAAVSSSTPAPTTSAAPPPPPPPRWPLTGVLMSAPVDRPAIAVKIENSVTARPQTGLNAADMVWEQVVEGGITRYVAVYHSSLPPEIGPVRSVRPMDPSIAGPLHGLFAFSGGQPPFPAAVAAAGLQVLSMDAGSAGFYRIRVRPAPHNVYASLAVFLKQADANHKHSPPAQFAFAGAGEQPTTVTAGGPAARLDLTLSGVSHPVWTWSPADRAWLRSEGTTPAVEANGHRLHATNVVVLRVDVVNTRYIDPAGNPVPETRLIGTGAAVVASAGHTVAATWSKSAVTSTLALTGADHQPITLAPGTTWIELVPNGTGAVSAH
jgi:hypothetical protein